jgi:hypothetical protein
MPVNIRTLTSNVNVTDSNSSISEEMLAQITQQVIMRLKQEQRAEMQLQEERDIRSQMTD